MRVRLSLLTLLCPLLACVTAMPPARPIARPVAYKGYYEAFPSGMRLVVYEDPAATRATVNVSYRVGASDEGRGQEGLAHLAEHLAFRGRPGGPGAPTMDSRLAATGAIVNAFTSHDQTDFWTHAPIIQLRSVLRLEAQRMRDALANVTEAEFLAERDVVIAELHEREEGDELGAQQALVLESALPAGHPYARSVSGTVQSLRALRLEDVRTWAQTYYRPARAVLVVTSPVKGPEVGGLVASSFGSLATGSHSAPVERTPPPLPERPAGPLVVKQAPVSHPRLWMSWAVPGRYSGQTPQALAASEILSSIMSYELLSLRVNDKVLGSDANALVLDGATLVLASVELESREDAPKVIDKVMTALHTLHDRAYGVDMAMNDVRARMVTDAFLGLEQLSTPDVAQYLRSTGKPDYVAGWPAQIRETLKHSLAPYTEKYLTADRVQTLLVVPDARGPSVASAASTRAAAGGGGELHGEDAELPPTGELDVRKVAQAPGLDRVERLTLSNGLQVVVARRGVVPLVDARLVIRTHATGTDGSAAALPALALYASWRSTGRQYAGDVGETVLQRVDEDFVLYGGSASSGNLPHLVDEMRQWVKNLDLSRSSFRKLRDAFADGLASNEAQPEYRAAVAFRSRLYPQHVLGAVPTPEQVRALDYGEAEDWLEQQILPSSATLYLTGDVTPGPELQAQLEGLLGGWKGGGSTGPRALLPAPAVPARRTVLLVDQPGASQAGFRIGLRGPKLDAEQEATAEALAWALERRLTRALREKQGVTYGVQVESQPHASTSALMVSTRVDRAAAAQALTLMLGTLGELGKAGVSEEAAVRARWQVASDYDLRFGTVSAAAEHLTTLAASQLPADYWERYPEAIARVDAAGMRSLAGALNLGSEVVVVVGDVASLQPQLEAAGFQVERLPAPAGKATKSASR
ncbi:insulinase family protein [Aggregicoccus sp. 17bor-14]|uniref:M16 family metallopeptidase n=1 Tax=Myxococcaceae TaxID=31 RepID=UPI00129C37F3|nr:MULTISPECIES: M16 family metallopeptidase [Myxococcaceae]MBF5042657.1 insulinase family protein [Simulacricoccus sp. 17bor-14]MRI88425.1 insulinase family protein [Aggregicoccus sp. 17bor-14]